MTEIIHQLTPERETHYLDRGYEVIRIYAEAPLNKRANCGHLPQVRTVFTEKDEPTYEEELLPSWATNGVDEATALRVAREYAAEYAEKFLGDYVVSLEWETSDACNPGYPTEFAEQLSKLVAETCDEIDGEFVTAARLAAEKETK